MSATKLDAYRERVGKLEAEKIELAGSIEQLLEAEEEAAFIAVREAPKKSPFVIGSPAMQARERRQKAEARLVNAEKELVALHRARMEEEARQAEIEHAEKMKAAKGLTQAEEEGLREVAELVTQAMLVWIEKVLGPAEERDALDASVRATLSAEAEKVWRRAMRPTITPFPADFPCLVERIVRVAADPHGDGYRKPHGGRLDSDRRLPELVPDLRGLYRHAKLSGYVDVITSAGFSRGDQPRPSGPLPLVGSPGTPGRDWLGASAGTPSRPGSPARVRVAE